MQDVEKAARKDEGGIAVHLTLDDFRGCYCVGGIDLSRTTDLTAAGVVIERGGVNYCLVQFFMPQKRYEIAIDEEGVAYNIFSPVTIRPSFKFPSNSIRIGVRFVP